MGELSVQCEPHEHGQEPWWVLQTLGPCIEVLLELHPSEAQQRILERIATPPPARALALVDTGASITVIDESIYLALRPTVYGTTPLKGIRDDHAKACPRFALRFSFPDSTLEPWEGSVAADRVRGKTSNQTVLLGRDFLRGKRFIYDGVNGAIKLIK